MATATLPAILHVQYRPLDEFSANVRLKIDISQHYVTILHDGACAVAGYELEAGQAVELTMSDSEAVALLIRFEGCIVASAILQVETRLMDEIGAILLPISTHNVIIDQTEVVSTSKDIGAVEAIKLIGSPR